MESLKTLREKYHDRIDIRIGLECEYFPQYIHWLKEQTKKYQLDYIIFGNHHYHTDEKFPYFGHHTDSRDMLELYEESAIERYGKRIILLPCPSGLVHALLSEVRPPLHYHQPAHLPYCCTPECPVGIQL